MKAVIQRVTRASVSIEEENKEIKENIGKGIVVFLGIGEGDDERDLKYLVDKIIHLRIFSDDLGKMNYSLLDIKGEILVVSQFTLYADCRKGRRPDFTNAATPEKAQRLYNEFIFMLKQSNLRVKSGRFAAEMIVEIYNDGPVTLILDTKLKNFLGEE